MIESEKKTFAKLFDGRQPVWITGKRRAAHGETNILELFGNDRGRLEPRKAVQAGHLTQSVYGNQRGDTSQEW
jgi:hypothetical protein